MRKKTKHLPFFIAASLVLMSFSPAFFFSNPTCPINYTGAPKATTPNLGQVKNCNNCHSGSLNPAGGNVVATGLPVGTYTPGQVYNFTVKITHAAADRGIWGFAIKAVNTVNNDVAGTLSAANTNVTVKGSVASKNLELSHENAATAVSNNYTYLNLTWTAPSVPNTNENNIRFYITGVAGDDDGSESGDYVYTSIVNTTLSGLPVILKTFSVNRTNDNSVLLSWQTVDEMNLSHFDIETSSNSTDWQKISSIAATGKSVMEQNYTYRDRNAMACKSNIYYRIKMVDINNSFKYSDVQMVYLKNSGIVINNVTPQPLQPSQNAIFKVYSPSANNLNVIISDMAGRKIYTQRFVLNKGDNTIEIPGEKMNHSKGVQFVKFYTNEFEKTFKLLLNQ